MGIDTEFYYFLKQTIEIVKNIKVKVAFGFFTNRFQILNTTNNWKNIFNLTNDYKWKRNVATGSLEVFVLIDKIQLGQSTYTGVYGLSVCILWGIGKVAFWRLLAFRKTKEIVCHIERNKQSFVLRISILLRFCVHQTAFKGKLFNRRRICLCVISGVL